MNRLAGLGLGLALLFALVPVASVGAATITDFEHRVLNEINGARVSRGLVPLRTDGRLWDLAGDRAAAMASANVLSHTVAGSLNTSLARRGISWYSNGETIAYTTTTGWAAAADAIVKLWQNSAPHWALLMSAKFNYVGSGLAYRSSNHRTYASIVLTESWDHSGARASITGGTLTGTAIAWTWQGWDLALQTHTAGLRDFTVQIRRGAGSWVTLATNTTATARTTSNLAHGSSYYLRVRARDRNGNIGAWSATRRVWVP
jgi:hypothetical protein